MVFPSSEAYISSYAPPTGTSFLHIDTTPPVNNSHPLNSRIIGCPAHGVGREPSTSTLPQNINSKLQQHGLIYHKDLLSSTPPETLKTIGWFHCLGCSDLIFTQTYFDEHIKDCQPFQIFSRRQQYSNLLKRCHPSHIAELTTMINNNTDKHEMQQRFMEWMMEPSDNDTLDEL